MTDHAAAQSFPETTISAGDLTLRPLTDADTDDVTRACQDAEIQRWLPLPRPYTRAGAEWFIGTFGPSQRESGAGVVFAIESAGRLVGAIDLKHVDWAAKVAEVGYWVAPWARGRELPPGDPRDFAMGHSRPRLRAGHAVRSHGKRGVTASGGECRLRA